MSEVIPALKAEVEESMTYDDKEEVIGGEEGEMAPQEPDDLTTSDASTDKVNSGDDEKVQQQKVKEEKSDATEAELTAVNITDLTLSSKNTPGRGGATSRRGGGSRGAARRGGRGGRGRKGPDTFYSYPSSDFHATLFTPAKLHLPSGPFGLSANRPGNEGETDNRIPEKILVTPELITQLSSNINSGFFYVNNAMELLKQSQLELYHAKFALEKICRQNDLTQGDLYPQEFARPMEADQRQSGFSLDTGLTSVGNPPQTDGQGTATAESVQVQLDPFQFMDIQRSPLPPMGMAVMSPDFTIGRGGGGRGRRGARGGGPRRGRKRREPEQFSRYNSQVAKEGVVNLVKRFASSLDGKRAKDLNNNRHAAVVLHDIGPVLNKRGNGKSSHFEASKIEASFEKEMKRVAKLTRPIFKTGPSSSTTSNTSNVSIKNLEAASTKQSCSGSKAKLSEGDVEDGDMEMEEERKQVSQKEKPPQRIDVEENEASKVPELVTSNPNNNSSTRTTRRTQPSPSIKPTRVRQVEDNRLLLKKTSSSPKNVNLPRWRQLRVDPAVMERIHKRLDESASQSDTESFYSSVSNNSQQSASSGEKRHKKNSPSSQQSKRPKVDPSSSSSSLSSTSVSSTTSNISDVTMKSINSGKSTYSGATPSDEEMLELTPNKDNCDCMSSSKEEEKLGKDRGEIVQFSTKVLRVTVDSAFDNNDDSVNSEGPDEEDERETEEEDDGSNNSIYFSDVGEEEDDDDDEDLFVEVRRKKHEGELIIS